MDVRDLWVSEEEIKEKEKEQKEIADATLSVEEEVALLRSVVRDLLLEKDMTEEEKLEYVYMYEDWILLDERVKIEAGTYLRYKDELYKVLISHPKQADYRPDVAVSLFTKVVPDGIVPEWKTPDSSNPFMKGDKATYKGVVWVSKIDNNVTVPDGDMPYNRYWEPVE